jgi:hypothetical protein
MGYWNVNNIWKLAVGLLILTTIYYIIIGTTLSKDAFKTAAYVGLIIAIPTGILAIHQATEYIPIFISYLVFKYDQRAAAKRESEREWDGESEEESDRKKAIISENERRRLANIKQKFENFIFTSQQGDISEQDLIEMAKKQREQETGMYDNDDIPDGVPSPAPGWTRADVERAQAQNKEIEDRLHKKYMDSMEKYNAEQSAKAAKNKAAYEALMQPVLDMQEQIAYYEEQVNDTRKSEEDRDAARTTMYKIINELESYKNKKRIL